MRLFGLYVEQYQRRTRCLHGVDVHSRDHVPPHIAVSDTYLLPLEV